MTKIQELTYVDPQPTNLSPITLVLLDINTGINQLLNGAIIVVKDYADNLNKDLYIRYNSTTKLTEIAYNLYTDNTLDYWQAFDVPINVFTNYNCYNYEVGITDNALPVNTTILYTSHSDNIEDSALITGIYTDSNNNLFYTISRDTGFYQLN